MSPSEAFEKANGIRIDVGGFVQKILLAAVLGIGAFLWAGWQRIPTVETMEALKAKAATVDQMRLDLATDRADFKALREDVGEVKVQLAEIERLLRARMGMRDRANP
jgi:hypothetical protein